MPCWSTSRAIMLALVLLSAPVLAIEVTPDGAIRHDGQTRPLAGVVPVVADWPERLAAIVEGVDWTVESIEGGWRLTHGRHDAADVLIKTGAARPAGTASDAQQVRRRGDAAGTGRSFQLDGLVYTPVESYEYFVGDGLVVISTGRDLYCASQGDSAGLPVADLMVVIDGRIIPINGADGAPAPVRDRWSERLLVMESRHLDMHCGEPDALRLQLAGPAQARVDQPAPWRVRATNHTDASLAGIEVSVPAPDGVDWEAAQGPGWTCQVAADQVTCDRAALAAGETEAIDLTGTPSAMGVASATCTGSMASEGRVADGNCQVASEVAGALAVSISQTGPDEPIWYGEPFVWQVVIENVGDEPVADLAIVERLPDGVDYLGSTGVGWTCTASGGDVRCEATDLAVGQTRVLEIEASTNAPGAYMVDCVVEVAGVEVDPAVGDCQHTVEAVDFDLLFRDAFEAD